MPRPPLRRFFGIQSPDPETREKAVEAPGASWREFLYFELAKIWILLMLFILDSWLIAFWVEVAGSTGIVGGVVTLGGAIYGEVLLYRYLWFEPDPEKEVLWKEFRPTWLRLTRYGRWTPPAWRIRDGLDAYAEPPRQGPDPREFL
jgi:hypothetical protein